jgi:hypothetical protein
MSIGAILVENGANHVVYGFSVHCGWAWSSSYFSANHEAAAAAAAPRRPAQYFRIRLLTSSRSSGDIDLRPRFRGGR